MLPCIKKIVLEINRFKKQKRTHTLLLDLTTSEQNYLIIEINL